MIDSESLLDDPLECLAGPTEDPGRLVSVDPVLMCEVDLQLDRDSGKLKGGGLDWVDGPGLSKEGDMGTSSSAAASQVGRVIEEGPAWSGVNFWQVFAPWSQGYCL